MSISQNIHKTTVRIECSGQGGISVGTGFWFSFFPENADANDVRYYPILVTNKHVIAGATEITLRFNLRHPTKEEVRFNVLTITQGESAFIMHPDENVDICILPIAENLKEIEDNGFKPEIYFFTDRDLLDNRHINPVEDIYMIGYPNGLWDSENNKPVVRKGITASSPLENWKGKSEFLIDMACFGGSSGSPVFIMNQGSYPYLGGQVSGDRLIFLGILYAGPVIDVNGYLEIVDVPTVATTIVRSSSMMNLGLAIKAERLLDFKPMLGLV
jgi:hypothetical protein